MRSLLKRIPWIAAVWIAAMSIGAAQVSGGAQPPRMVPPAHRPDVNSMVTLSVPPGS